MQTLVAIHLCLLALICSTILSLAEDIGTCPLDSSRLGDCHSGLPRILARPSIPSDCFRAAVFEHDRIDLPSIGEGIEANLDVYSRVAKLANQNGAKIIVFPEDGILHPRSDQLKKNLREIPDPRKLQEGNNNPCLQPDEFQSDILIRLSCIARDSGLYVVANFGTIQKCQPNSMVGRVRCPKDGMLALNTDVALDSEGRFVTRYRKNNLFIEIFDKTPDLEWGVLSTPYGKFGIITCFDIMFKQPAVDLVEKLGVETLIFPTWWFDELPLLSAIQIQDGWSQTMNVSILASNIYQKSLGSVGSSIFSGQQSIYTGANSTKPKLLLANLPTNRSMTEVCNTNFDPMSIEVDTTEVQQRYKHKNFAITDSDKIISLKGSEGHEILCSGELCCTFDYQLASKISQDKLSRVAMIVRNSPRAGRFIWYEQICAMVALAEGSSVDNYSDIKYSSDGLATFKKLSIQGRFDSPYVYPISAYSVSELIGRNERDFSCSRLDNSSLADSCKLEYSSDKSSDQKPISSFGLYGRVYELDQINN